MARRLEVAHRELLQSHYYQHRVVNDNDVAASVTAIERILFDAGLPEPAAKPRQHHTADHGPSHAPDHSPHTPSGAQT